MIGTAPQIPDDLPAGFVVISADGRVQFGWQNPETGQFFAESDGSCIVNAIGAIAWASDQMH
ncbi:hypothetical protein LFL96_34695 (plasmid) [Paraburkholderia sp. D15]|uniref:hypothetical protein n=1 Tax=Paraburkholderia sp. D15 TaxID=2880218 RepID=UPI002479C1FF|nr:hypothetical protein [Paraburkholderia sp. D15]WGS55102.1 hypothetical protein LFL96_34695 [Paraburkholderia sp. D15]